MSVSPSAHRAVILYKRMHISSNVLELLIMLTKTAASEIYLLSSYKPTLTIL